MTDKLDTEIDDFMLVALEHRYEKQAAAQQFRYDDEESDYEEIDTSAIPIADALPKIEKTRGELDTPIAPVTKHA